MKNKRNIFILVGIVVVVFSVLLFFLSRPKYSCPDISYKLKNKRCLKTEVSKPYQNLNCPADYKTEENQCVKIKSVEANYKYDCPEGYTLKNQMCQKKMTTGFVTNYYCNRVKTDEATCDTYKSPIIDYSTGKKYCEKGTLVGSNCVVTTKSTVKKECPTGYKKINKVCEKTVSEAATVVWSCEEGYTLNDKTCEQREYKEGTWETICKEGFTLQGDKCYRKINIAATKKGK